MSSSSSGDGDGDSDPKLPQVVVAEILKRLPVESVLRCRCVCRSWRAAVDDPDFAAVHLRHSALDAPNWHTACLDWWDPVQNLCSLFPKGSLTLPPGSQIEIPFATPPDCYMIVGSCDGLICLLEISSDGFSRTMCLWNLFTRKHKAVRLSGPDMETGHMVLGFGCDARSMDYKIVRIIYLPDDYRRPKRRYFAYDYRRRVGRVEIYSLRKDSWRSLEGEAPDFRQDNRAVFLNGHLHWLSSYREDGGYGSIVSFDVAREVFDEMALSEEMFPVERVYLQSYMAVLNDSLAVFINGGVALGQPHRHSVCSVWVMRDYGVPESWTKLYTFKDRGPGRGFDGFTWNGELLFEMPNGARVSWNPITGQFVNLPLSTTCDLVTVIESLVSF